MTLIIISGQIIKVEKRMGKVKPYTLLFIEKGMLKNYR